MRCDYRKYSDLFVVLYNGLLFYKDMFINLNNIDFLDFFFKCKECG